MRPLHLTSILLCASASTFAIPCLSQTAPAPRAPAPQVYTQTPVAPPSQCESPPCAAPESGSHLEWYGYQILGASVPGHVAMGLSLSDNWHDSAALGISLWGVGGPIVHLLNRHPVRALGSFLLRGVFLGAGFYAGLSSGCTAESGCWSSSAFEAVLVGGSVFDALVLGWESVEDRAPSAPRATPPQPSGPGRPMHRGLALQPLLAVQPNRAFFGLAGQF
ncbi:MAG: hypothetical protein HY898_01620 [Deltaproteobacteria bacterium]|nr:hypothetical protein [Deltaproteobacteria bacterium]